MGSRRMTDKEYFDSNTYVHMNEKVKNMLMKEVESQESNKAYIYDEAFREYLERKGYDVSDLKPRKPFE